MRPMSVAGRSFDRRAVLWHSRRRCHVVAPASSATGGRCALRSAGPTLEHPGGTHASGTGPRARRSEDAVAGKLVGTDGVRGSAGAFLTAELALALGRAATSRIDAERPQVAILRDTRESGEMLESALAAGVSSAGGDALLAGILPTPAAPLLVTRYGFDLAIVVSASHNPYQDNGIKFFGADGNKLSDERERDIELELERTSPSTTGASG